ncbi:MAG: alanine--tRNA ligase [Gammaproteobacteria bacterium]
MKTAQIRQQFLDFFAKLGHTIVPGSSLVPTNDPTLLFTNAGMVQFKEVFLGQESRPYTRATSSQPCVRAGGKHNDLENVGYTARHHTFFEMLGNFSFGNYFKRDAIHFAWQFLTEVLKIPANRLWITVFKDDQEAADIWLNDIKIDPKRFSRCGEQSNFWSMGDTGPCGPCTEIFYDHGPSIPGGPPGSPEEDGDRYVEIWNLVFMQYNRAADGTLTPLPKPSVDTGMGLERIAAVMQGVHNNYDIDIFQHLLNAIRRLTPLVDTHITSARVIADHIRSAAFLITDGITPSNEGRGYVLRRIIRRAIRHGYKLGLHDPFFYRLVAPLVEVMGQAYPELTKAQPLVEQVIQAEEQQFASTLTQGMKLLEQEVTKLTTQILPGDVVFRLYDTYGFPPDLTADIARERDLTLDYAGFEKEMTKQRQQSRETSRFTVDYTQLPQLQGETEFTGYEQFTDESIVTALLQDGQEIERLPTGQSGAVVLDRTPFYAEAGGQVGDSGYLFFENGSFRVHDTKKQGMVHVHYGQVEKGTLQVGTKVSAEVDSSRQATMLNHSATHLLHAALRYILGEHVIQKGSLVDPQRLRFDFSHPAPLSPEQLSSIERLVNQQIRANLAAETEILSPEEAKTKGAMALFGEKYGERVRVLSMGEFSMELCGGTHAARTGDIGLFKIISETGIAAGIRRIEALTGEHALEWINEQEKQMQSLMQLLKTNRENLAEKFQQTLQRNRSQEKELLELKNQQAKWQSTQLAQQAVIIGDIKVLAAQVLQGDNETLRNLVDQLKNQLNKAVVVLAVVNDGQVQLVCGITKNCTDKLRAGELMAYLAQQVGGKGGGRPDLAQGGGNNPAALTAALHSVVFWVKEKLQ